MRHGQRAEDHSIQQRIRRCACPDGEPQRDDRRRSETGALAQQPQSVAQIAPQVLQPVRHAHPVARLPHHQRVAELHPRSPRGLFRLYAFGHQVRRALLQVVRKLLVNLPVQLRRPEHVADFADYRHAAPLSRQRQASASTRETAPVTAVQRSCSAASRFRPSLVIS